MHCHWKISSYSFTQKSLQCIVTERSLNMLLLKDPLIHFYQKIPSYFVTGRSLNTLSLMWLFNSNVVRLQNNFVINYLVLWFHIIVLYKKNRIGIPPLASSTISFTETMGGIGWQVWSLWWCFWWNPRERGWGNICYRYDWSKLHTWASLKGTENYAASSFSLFLLRKFTL